MTAATANAYRKVENLILPTNQAAALNSYTTAYMLKGLDIYSLCTFLLTCPCHQKSLHLPQKVTQP